jgi:hypothetical protein
MKYFKDAENNLYVDPIVENHVGLVELTEQEFNNQLAINNAPPVLTQQTAKDAINEAAGNARLRIQQAFVSPGYGTLDEYNNTALEVKRWRDAGSPVGNVPRAVTAWSTPKGITDEQAATELEAQEALLRGKLDDVRELRLAGTISVDYATADWETVAQPYIDSLNSYDPLA